MKTEADLEDPRDGLGRLHYRSESNVPLLTDYSSPHAPAKLFDKPRSFVLSARVRRLLFTTCASLLALSFIIVASLTAISPRIRTVQPVPAPNAQATQPEGDEDSHLTDVSEVLSDLVVPSHSPYVLGPPTTHFRDNLRNATNYITSWISAGWTNDVMTYANIIYLGMITGRVPIIAMFTPSHIGSDAETIAFGDVFDVPRFIQDSGVGIVEWRDVKDPASQELEDLGCWNIWEAVQYREHFPRKSVVPDHLGLDISYTKAPDWVHMIPNFEHDPHSTFWSLARLAFSEEREKSLVEALPTPVHQVRLPPDEHVLCYDYLYYVCAHQSFEFEYDYAPAWRFVGKYLRWTPQIQDITASYLRRAFHLSPEEEVPPYIAIHVRHGDFGRYCEDVDLTDCFASIPVIARRVQEVQDELRTRKGVIIPDTRVVMTSDETDPAWWEEVRALGWAEISHDAWGTARIYGRWYPVLLDAAIQSSALGFIGTDRSTFSTLSRRRVQDWHDGATRIVKWGYKDADAH